MSNNNRNEKSKMKYLYNETKSRRNEILKYLYEHDNDFPIPLSHKTNLKQYLNKVICLGKSVIFLEIPCKILCNMIQ